MNSLTNIFCGLPSEHRAFMETILALVPAFAERAARHDRDATFPADDFADLRTAGLHAAAVPADSGGLGLGPTGGLYTLWMLTRTLAAADMSLARCWEGCINSQVLLASMGTTEQQQRWFRGIVHDGEIWACWSGEPQARTPEQSKQVGTHVVRVEDGYIVDGSKVFATSAGHARWAILLVNLHGPGGARHAQTDPDGLLLLVVDLKDASVRIDDSWWDPMGMRGTESHKVEFDRTFIPACHQLGVPGQYMRENWQTLFSPHYGATFLGGAEAALDYTMNYVQTQGTTDDPYVRQHLAQMSLNVQTSHLWLKDVAQKWENGATAEARDAGVRARFLIEKLSTDTLDRCIRACGARCLIRPGPIERIFRDLTFYVRHDNSDHVLAAIGKSMTDDDSDLSFFHQGR